MANFSVKHDNKLEFTSSCANMNDQHNQHIAEFGNPLTWFNTIEIYA